MFIKLSEDPNAIPLLEINLDKLQPDDGTCKSKSGSITKYSGVARHSAKFSPPGVTKEAPTRFPSYEGGIDITGQMMQEGCGYITTVYIFGAIVDT